MAGKADTLDFGIQSTEFIPTTQDDTDYLFEDSSTEDTETISEVEENEYVEEDTNTEEIPDGEDSSDAQEEIQDVTDESEVNPLNVVAQQMLDVGIFALREGETELSFEDPNALLKRFEEESQSMAQEYHSEIIGAVTDGELFWDSVFVKKMSPADFLKRYQGIQSVKNLDIKEESNQELVFRQFYKSQGRDAAFIEKRLTKIKDLGELEEEATVLHSQLLDSEEKALQEEAKKSEQLHKRQEAMKLQYEKSVMDILSEKLKAKEFDGIPVDANVANEVYDALTTEKWKLPDGTKLTDFDRDILELNQPKNHALKLKIYLLLKELKKDPELGILGKKQVTRQTNELFKGLQKTVKLTERSSAGTRNTNNKPFI